MMESGDLQATGTSSRLRPRSHKKKPTGCSGDVPVSIVGLDLEDAIHHRQQLNKKTGYMYDARSELHSNTFCPDFFENPTRTITAHSRCQQLGLLDRCEVMAVPEADDSQMELLHSKAYVEMVRQTASMSSQKLKELSATFDAGFYNEHTALAARLSVGGVLKMTEAVYNGELKNGFALVRPPGHHAMKAETAGYCHFNNVALAAKDAIDRLGAKRVLIVDWDVHHGQATQYMFYDNPKVLYFSIHRYDQGNFWPHLRESNCDFVGKDAGKGFNINVALNQKGMTNADYLAIFHNLLMPVAHEFNPDLVLVSCGFDCLIGCPLGQLSVHPALCAHMVHKLSQLANGKIVLALEGGYCVDSVAEGTAHVLRTLLGDHCPEIEELDEPSESLQESLLNTIKHHRSYWKCLRLQGDLCYEIFPDMSQLKDDSWSDIKGVGLPDANEKGSQINPSGLDKLKVLTESSKTRQYNNRTCLVYDKDMELHRNEEDSGHPECPQRIERIYEELKEDGLLDRCKLLPSRKATREELCLTHHGDHVNTVKLTATMTQGERIHKYCQYNSVFINEHSYDAALISAGSLLNVIDEVCSYSSLNGAAIVRPPGHHAEENTCMGFCFFNNVAIAARYAQQKHAMKRILIVDWDVHHGNGTQRMFENDPSVLYISLHRHDFGLFFPAGDYGAPESVGCDEGRGYSVNIAWNNSSIGDSEYLSAFFTVVLPIAHQFRPDLVLVSAGFDAAKGDPLGRLSVTPECFGQMTHLLSCLAEGRVILALEGGYCLHVVAQSMAHCVASLLGDPCSKPIRITKHLNVHGINAIRTTVNIHQQYWKCLRFNVDLPVFVKSLEGVEENLETKIETNEKPIEFNLDSIIGNLNQLQLKDEV